ncbi:unnamed protein product [Heligmosomoides polygyrus]|uniref:Glycine rich protein n=1 Tax=Heligmosomoides polygyrus TaxID=6339 RepID=A0A183G2A7_HELPZ|nr:unnamed protein product [Heligmosomoides polygyrus]
MNSSFVVCLACSFLVLSQALPALHLAEVEAVDAANTEILHRVKRYGGWGGGYPGGFGGGYPGGFGGGYPGYGGFGGGYPGFGGGYGRSYGSSFGLSSSFNLGGYNNGYNNGFGFFGKR